MFSFTAGIHFLNSIGGDSFEIKDSTVTSVSFEAQRSSVGDYPGIRFDGGEFLRRFVMIYYCCNFSSFSFLCPVYFSGFCDLSLISSQNIEANDAFTEVTIVRSEMNSTDELISLSGIGYSFSLFFLKLEY